jgi:hypothetical protein
MTPSELDIIEAAARGELPLRLGWQLLARPPGISFRVAIGDMHDRVIVKPPD